MKAAPPVDQRGRRHVLVASLLGVFVPLFPYLIVVAALPDMAKDLDTSAATVAWVLTAPLILGAAVLPAAGRLGDLFGHRRVFLVGLTISAVFSLLAARAGGPLTLISFRSISQASGTAVGPSAIALALSAHPVEERTRVLGLWAFATTAPAVGLLIGGPAADAIGWRGLFVIQAVAAFLIVPYGARVLHETERVSKVSFDVAGAGTFTLASAALVFGLDRAGRWGWGHPVVAVSLTVSILAAVSFVRLEGRVANPMLPPALLRHRSFLSSCSCELMVQIASNAGLFVLPLLLRQHYGTGVGRTSWYLAGLPVGMAIAAPFGGRVAKRAGERTMAMVGGVVLGGAMFAVIGADSRRWLALLVGAWVVTGLANGLIRPAITSSAAAALDPEVLGAGLAATRMVSTVGAAGGVTLGISLLPLGGARLALVAAGVASVLCALAATGLVSSSRATPSIGR